MTDAHGRPRGSIAPRLTCDARGASRNLLFPSSETLIKMTRTTKPIVAILVSVMLVAGCKSGPKFAWWKRDKPSDDTSAVARSAETALPSAQSTPQAVAVAGLTPAAPPSSTNLAAASSATASAGTTTGTTLHGATSTGIAQGATATPSPLAGPTAQGTPLANYSPQNAMADRIAATPSARTGATAGATAGATPGMMPGAPATGAAVAAAGPYDPNAYQGSAGAGAVAVGALEASDDRYGLGNTAAAPRATAPMAATAAAPIPAHSNLPANSTVPTNQSLASDPADRYGSSRTSTAPPALPGMTPITDPATVAADRYANPNLPSLAHNNAAGNVAGLAGATGATQPLASGATTLPITSLPTAPQTATTVSPAAVRLASSPGMYRPGRTSTYAGSASYSPLKIASRPKPVAATGSTVTSTATTTAVTPATSAATPTPSSAVPPSAGATQPWPATVPSVPTQSAPPTSVPTTRTY